MKKLQRGVLVSQDAWNGILRLAARQKKNVLPFAGDVLERFVAQQLPPPPWIDAWMDVPAESRESVRESLKNDIAIFAANADVPEHLAGLKALLTILEKAEVK